MSLFGKIKSVIKGNPVLKEYEVGKHVCSAGPGLRWKVFNGVKKSTKQEASVFIFDKQTPEIEKAPKKQREALFEMLKRGPAHLAKLRHPKLLTIQHQVEESNDCIAFATEPIRICLANVLGFYENLPSPLPLAIKEYQLHPVEAHYGLLQIAEALNFLHTAANMLHGNLTPESVAITPTGDWKLAGFNFACFVQYQTSAQTTFNFREWDSPKSLHANPNLDFLAPEYILTQNCGTYSDAYSFGMLCYSIYNGGRPLCENRNNTLAFKQNVEQISRVTEAGLGDVPMEMKPLVRSLLVIEPSVRPDALQVTKHSFFNNVMIEALLYLDTLFEKSDMEKSQWFKKSLARIVLKLPKRVIHQRVLPALSNEFRNHKMIPFVLPIVLLIAEDCTIQEYTSLVLKILIPAFKIQDPIQVPLIFLQKMDLLLKMTPPETTKQHILPMILSSLGSSHSQVQELCVTIIPTFADMVDYTSMKHSIIPRLTSLCISTPSVGLCVKCLVTVGHMLEALDRNIVIDQILPKVVQIKSREPGVLMGILGIYHKAMTTKNMELDKQYLATKALPFLIPLCLEPTLNPTQFQHFMVVVREMLKKIEVEHHAHLVQLSKMEEQTKTTVDFAREVAEAKAMDDTVRGIEDMVGSSNKREEVLGSRLGTSVATLKPTISESSPSDPFDLFAGLSLDTLESSLATPTPTTQPNLPVHGATPTGATTQVVDGGLKKIDFGEGKGSPSGVAQQLVGGLSGSGAHFLTPETQPSSLGPTGPSSLSQSSSGLVSSLSVMEKKASPNPSSLGWSSTIAGSGNSASPSFRPGSSLASAHTSTGSSAFEGSSGTSLLQPQLQMGSGSTFGTPGMMTAGNRPGNTQTGLVPSQSILQPQSGMNLGSGMSVAQSGIGRQAGPGTDLLQPQSAMTPLQSSSQTGLLQPQSGMVSLKPDLGMGLLQQQSGMSLQSDLGHVPLAANSFGTGGGLNTDSSFGMSHCSQPLQPSQPSSSYNSGLSGGMGWSSGIVGQQQASATPPSSMGWSSGIMGQQQASATPPSSMGWSTGIAGQNLSYSSGLGSGGMNTLGLVSVDSATPPTAASLMMGASQPLTPQQHQQQQQPSQRSFLQPSPGPNPFVNNNSLI